MTDPLVETWLINHRVNLRLLDNLSDEALAATLSTRGGRSVGMQLAHVHNNRLYHLENADKELYGTLALIPREQGNDRAALAAGLVASGEAVAELIRRCLAAGGQMKGFKRGLVVFTGYLIAHEAHHRGHALLTVKQSGLKIPEALKWGSWEWNKI